MTQAGKPTINDVLKHMPGVYMGGSPSEDKDVRLAGIDKEFTRVSFGGVTLPDGGEKREFNVDRVPSALIQSVSIVNNRGAEHEADGIAGKVILKPISADNNIRPNVSLALGGKNSLGVDAKQANVSYAGAISDRVRMATAFSYLEQPFHKDKQRHQQGVLLEQEQETRDSRNTAWYNDIAYQYSDAGSLHLKALYLDGTEDKDKRKDKYKKGVFDGYDAEDGRSDKTTWGLTLVQDHTFNDSVSLKGELGYYRTTEDKDKTKQTANAKGVIDNKKTSLETEHKVDGFWQGKLDATIYPATWHNHTVTTGVMWRERERDKNKLTTADNQATKSESKANYQLDERYLATYLQDTIQLTDKLNLQAGLRYEHSHLVSQDGTNRRASSETNDLLPSASINYQFSPDTKVTLAYSRAVNRPKFDYLSPFIEEKKDEYIQGNPNLKPAKAHNFDLSLSHQWQNLNLGANLFYKDISDLIEENTITGSLAGRRILQPVNVGNGTLTGLTLSQSLQFGTAQSAWLKDIRLDLNQSFFDSEVTEANGTTRRFKEQPSFLANAVLNWQLPTNTRLSLAYHYVGERKPVGNENGIQAEGYLDIGVRQAFANDWSLYGNINNVTNQQRVKYNNAGNLDTEEGSRIFWVGLSKAF